MLYIQCTTLAPACLCPQYLFVLTKEDLSRIFPCHDITKGAGLCNSTVQLCAFLALQHAY